MIKKYNKYSFAAIIVSVSALILAAVGSLMFRTGIPNPSPTVLLGIEIAFALTPIACTAATILSMIAIAKDPNKMLIANLSIIISSVCIVFLFIVYADGNARLMDAMRGINL